MKNILLIILTITNIVSIVAYLTVVKKIVFVTRDVAKLAVKNIPPKEIVDTEGFIKFLSESREWAFSYIEDVQTALIKFVDSIDKEIEYFDKYGSVMGNNPNHDILMTISKEYKELKKILPTEK